MKLLDASVIIAFFRDNEALHDKAVAIFQAPEDYVIMDHILGEVITVLKLREGFEMAKNALAILTNVEGIRIYETQPEIFWSAIDAYGKTKNKLSFIDTLILTLAKENRLELLTFDKDLAKAGYL